MKQEIKKYKKLLEKERQKAEYEKFIGFSGEKRLFHKPEEPDLLFEQEEN